MWLAWAALPAASDSEHAVATLPALVGLEPGAIVGAYTLVSRVHSIPSSYTPALGSGSQRVEQRTHERAPLGELGGARDPLGARRPASHLPNALPEPLHRGTPAGPPGGTQTSAPTPTARRSANRRASHRTHAARHMAAVFDHVAV